VSDAISLSDAGFFYRRGEKWIFRNLNVGIAKGSICSILGPNGSGKTTLLHLLIGALTPCEGTVIVDGRTALVPQSFGTIFEYSALDIVLMGRAAHIGMFGRPSKCDVQIALGALGRLGMEKYASSPFQNLSGGQQQLVIFARAIASDPNILILDEPTASLDFRNQALILDWLVRLSSEEKLTIVFTTHQPHHASAICDFTIVMDRHNKISFGAPGDVLSDQSLSDLFETPMRTFKYQENGHVRSAILPMLDVRPSRSDQDHK
jgi:iron complex transport system ATP-binding protein